MATDDVADGAINSTVSIVDDEIKYLYHNDPTKFEPHLYQFKINSKDIGEDAAAVSPPFWILMDHLIAVMWYMYSQSNLQNLGVVQIQWALEFIKCIKKGEYLKNVATIIDSMEDMLLEKFAYMKEAEVEVPYTEEEAEVQGETPEGGPESEDAGEEGENDKPVRIKPEMFMNSVILSEIMSSKNSTFVDKEHEMDTDGVFDVEYTPEGSEVHSYIDLQYPKCSETEKESEKKDDLVRRRDVLAYLKSLHEDQREIVYQEIEKLGLVKEAIRDIQEKIPVNPPD